ncbi:hypothetical protein PAXINDRAFT_168994 [Paxillus involutus ATCC 200175]|uniref:Unplaced genomic scaffold PAXINscaffold_14, whole genome shotgun sequence n=1 Tax=Paxillus involutus ATCC 200175 TaxID=664439 RepID=A0A0C9TYV2_PAXIN|nr:hypothetical protein PAXINDRAFT_168994 [Paxillus involutus ATCC 200175]
MVLAVPQRTASFSAARFGSRPSSSFGLSSCPAPLRIVNRPSVCFYSSGTQHQTGPGNQSSPTTEHSSGPDPTSSAHEAQDKGTSGSWGNDGRGSLFPITGSPLLDAALTTVVGLGIVFVGGVAYIAWYKKTVLDKIEQAFSAGYDPALELAKNGEELKSFSKGLDGEVDDTPWTGHLRRQEQDTIDGIIKGQTRGYYYFLIGPKGGGKSTLILDAMRSIEADGVAFLDVHPDLEVFRLRLGKALDYEFNEDSQTGLFQRRDPREGGPALDIERALNKLEKVALRCARRTGKPLVLVFNNIQHFKNDDDGRHMLLQLQQKAEAWAAGGIVTVVFSSDDFWPFLLMRKAASRMHVLSIRDLSYTTGRRALTHMRISRKKHQPDEDDVEKAVSTVGGRVAYLGKVSRADDVVKGAKELLQWEKAWLLSQIGLIPDCDDDVMDEQKWSSCSWLLLKEFVKLYQEREKECKAAGEPWDPTELPSIPYWRCRQIMTRADFMEDLDRVNIVSVDVNLDVAPDSMLILLAAREVVEEDGFDDTLNNVRDRVDEIESLHRTRELTFKDLVRGDTLKLKVDKSYSPDQ